MAYPRTDPCVHEPFAFSDCSPGVSETVEEASGHTFPAYPEERGPTGITFWVTDDGTVVGHQVSYSNGQALKEQEVPFDLLRWGDDGGGNPDLAFVS